MPAIPKTLFVGWGVSVVSYYRCFLPAVALGADYVAWHGDRREHPPADRPGRASADLRGVQGLRRRRPPGGPRRAWVKIIRELQAAGVTVLYEIDDYVQAARKIKSHELSEVFDAAFVKEMELAMGVCDGIICSTDYIARRYRAFNERTWACYNGIDFKRYATPRPAAQGRDDRLGRRRRPQGLARALGVRPARGAARPARVALRVRRLPRRRRVRRGVRPERAIALPPAKIEVYPASMSLFDIAIAPSSESNLFKGKSDLRWLEASALGVPLVAHPDVYPEIEDGVTGVHARTPAEVEAALLRLIDDAELRERIGASAHAYVGEHRSIEVAAERWRDVLLEVGAKAPVAVA